MMSYEEAMDFLERYNTTYPDRSIDVLWIGEGIEDWQQVDGFSLHYTDNLKDRINKK